MPAAIVETITSQAEESTSVTNPNTYKKLFDSLQGLNAFVYIHDWISQVSAIVDPLNTHGTPDDSDRAALQQLVADIPALAVTETFDPLHRYLLQIASNTTVHFEPPSIETDSEKTTAKIIRYSPDQIEHLVLKVRRLQKTAKSVLGRRPIEKTCVAGIKIETVKFAAAFCEIAGVAVQERLRTWVAVLLEYKHTVESGTAISEEDKIQLLRVLRDLETINRKLVSREFDSLHLQLLQTASSTRVNLSTIKQLLEGKTVVDEPPHKIKSHLDEASLAALVHTLRELEEFARANLQYSTV